MLDILEQKIDLFKNSTERKQLLSNFKDNLLHLNSKKDISATLSCCCTIRKLYNAADKSEGEKPGNLKEEIIEHLQSVEHEL